jgi:NAD+ kinase
VKRVILSPNPYRDKDFATLREAMAVLKGAGIDTRVCLPFEVDRNYELPRDIRFSRLDRELPGADMLICFGGDGTLLHTAKTATRHGIPVLGVNIGTMGFMAELESSELSQLARIANDDYTVDNRMMLDVTVHRDRDIIFHDLCLNDVAITKGAVARIVHLKVQCDGVQAMECGGDGIIVATPTGSTAYNLSAGGPIVEPTSREIIVTPVCAHQLAARAMVFASDRVITVQLPKDSRKYLNLAVDGGKSIRITGGERVEIRRASRTTKLIRLTDRNFYQIVNQKLGGFQG